MKNSGTMLHTGAFLGVVNGENPAGRDEQLLIFEDAMSGDSRSKIHCCICSASSRVRIPVAFAWANSSRDIRRNRTRHRRLLWSRRSLCCNGVGTAKIIK